MSLINDVLKQLDARVSMQSSERVFVEVPAAPQWGVISFLASSKVKRLSILLAGLLTGYYGAGIAGDLFGDVAVKHFASATVQADVNLPVPAVNDAHFLAGTGELSTTGALVPIVPSQLSSMPLVDEYSRMLSAADQLLALDRLTFPPLNNAFALYRQILIKDPDNSAALLGIEAIKQRYMVLTQDALSSQELNKAQRYIERAEFVGVSQESLSPLREQLQSLKAEFPSGSARDSQNAQANSPQTLSLGSVDTEAVADLDIDTKNRNQVTIDLPTPHFDESNVAAAGNSEPLRQRQSLTLGAAAGQSEEQQFLSGLSADAMGEAMAKQYISSHPQALATIRWLAARLQARQDWFALLELMNHVSGFDSHERDRFRAQSLLGLNRFEDIIGWLGRHNIAQQPELQRILAVAYQKAGQHQQALSIYQQLAATHPNNAGLWLAVGVNADALGNKAVAKEGFFRAQQLGGHSVAVAEYISRKLSGYIN